ncbi:hypothetical protein PEX2_008910 [Penicillium expansum]|uniref:DUF7708 domain-containing protein n=1 Tax=Penicillium expansum TaxID=27334 RepID=A0A0A2J7L2_PENEN|nr:hypothetical protein PEX2_008910 [Penicillium expansum]KGO51324.1 hypothetical protein PEX2_008910 [Penicillium expansum]
MNFSRPVEPSGGLIRRFSDDISDSSPGEPLGRALAAKVAVNRNQERSFSLRVEWDQLLLEGRELAEESVPDEEAVLLQQSQRLYAAWNKFRSDLPRDQHLELGDWDRPDINFLVATVSKASATWQSGRDESKLGRLKSKFQGLCNTCLSHSTLLSVIPKDDKYVTLLTGSLSAIAQATINHQKIAEGVADTLEDLSHDIDIWNRQMIEHVDIPSLRRYIQELYVVIFEFFTEIFTKWSKSSWKRFLTSFDESAFNELFTSKKNRILAIQSRMNSHISLDFHHRTTRSLEMMIQQQNMLYQNQERLSQILPDQLNQLCKQRLLVGESLERLLDQQQYFRLEQPRPSSITSVQEDTAGEILPSASTNNDLELEAPKSEVSPVSQTHYQFTRKEIQAEIKRFTDQWKSQVDHLIQVTKQAPLLQVNREVHNRLVTWLRASSSTNFWIQGPHDVPQPSQNSMTAVSLAALARNNNIPCIIYFCSFTECHEPGDSKALDLGSFLASIITQLVQLIPDYGYTEADLSIARFAALARGMLSVPEVLQLILDIRVLGPRVVYGFIDNIQVLEDQSDQDYTQDFLRTIATLCRLGRGAPRPDCAIVREDEGVTLGTRMCFTTDGYVDGLAQASERQLLDKVEFDLETNDPLPGEIGGGPEWDREEKDD